MLLLSRTVVAHLMDFPTMSTRSKPASAPPPTRVAPPAAAFPVPSGSYHAKAAALLAGDPPVMAIKLNGNYPGNPAANGLPTVQGVIYLADATNGRPLALGLDEITITHRRATTSRPATSRAATRASPRLRLRRAGPHPGQGDRRGGQARHDPCLGYQPDAAEKLARELTQELKIEVRPSADRGDAQSDIIVTATSSRVAFLTLDMVRPGTFIAAVGADNSDKSEIAPALYGRSQPVVDSLEQCVEIGDVHHAVKAKAVTRRKFTPR